MTKDMLNKIKDLFLSLNKVTKITILLLVSSAVIFSSGFYLFNSSEDDNVESETIINQGQNNHGEVAGESMSATASQTPTSSNSGSTNNPISSTTPTPNLSTNDSSKPMPSPSTSSSNYSTYQYPSPSTQPTNIIIYTPEKMSKAECDAKRAALDSDFYFAVNNSKNNYENEVKAVTLDYARRGIPISSGVVQDALRAVEEKYSTELDHLEADYNNQVDLLIAEGCEF